MAKSYPDQLSQWVKRHPPFRRDKNLAIFLALRHDVSAALDAGFSMKTVWSNMHEARRVEFSYETFVGFVNRILRNPDSGLGALQISTPNRTIGSSPNTNSITLLQPVKTIPTTSQGFDFDSSPNKEELL